MAVLAKLPSGKVLLIEELDPDFADMPIMRERRDNAGINCAISNSFGFGGTNGSLVMRRV